MDGAEQGWHGHVGVVTELLADLPLDPTRTAAVVCRPEVMLRLAARVLADRAVPAPAIRVSLERNMKCAVGHFGRCQLRPGAVCRDGAVFDYQRVTPLLATREL